MTEKKKSTQKTALVLGIFALIICVFTLVYKIASPTPVAGAKQVTLEVIDNRGDKASYELQTDAEYLSQTFDEIEDLSVEGEDGDYGLFITTVNGVTADYDADGSYWSIYVNGEYGQYSADQQVVNNGDEFTLKYETYGE